MQYWQIFSSFLIFCCYFKVAKYEKLGKYFSYCTRHRAITTTNHNHNHDKNNDNNNNDVSNTNDNNNNYNKNKKNTVNNSSAIVRKKAIMLHIINKVKIIETETIRVQENKYNRKTSS